MEYLDNYGGLSRNDDYRVIVEGNMILLQTPRELTMINPEDGCMESVDRDYNIGDSLTFEFEYPVTIVLTEQIVNALSIEGMPDNNGVTIREIRLTDEFDGSLVEELDLTATASEITTAYLYKIESLYHRQTRLSRQQDIMPSVWRITIGDSPIYSFVSYDRPKVIKCWKWHYIFIRDCLYNLDTYKFENWKGGIV